jgi:hypothetical protein
MADGRRKRRAEDDGGRKEGLPLRQPSPASRALCLLTVAFIGTSRRVRSSVDRSYVRSNAALCVHTERGRALHYDAARGAGRSREGKSALSCAHNYSSAATVRDSEGNIKRNTTCLYHGTQEAEHVDEIREPRRERNMS